MLFTVSFSQNNIFNKYYSRLVRKVMVWAQARWQMWQWQLQQRCKHNLYSDIQRKAEVWQHPTVTKVRHTEHSFIQRKHNQRPLQFKLWTRVMGSALCPIRAIDNENVQGQQITWPRFYVHVKRSYCNRSQGDRWTLLVQRQ